MTPRQKALAARLPDRPFTIDLVGELGARASEQGVVIPTLDGSGFVRVTLA